MFNPDKREEVHLIFDILCEYRKRFPFNMDVAPVWVNDGLDPRYTEDDLRWAKEAAIYFDALQKAVKVKVTKKPPTMMRMFHDLEIDGERKIIEAKDKDYNTNLTNGLTNFKGMYCVANTTLLHVTETGLCKGLICSPIFTCNIYEKGSLKATRDKLIYTLKCRNKLCGCTNANYPPKFASFEESQKFMEIFNAKQQALFDAVR